MLAVARATLIELGYPGTTMAEVARRAGASKETLYAWYGGRAGLIRRLIEESADHSAAQVTARLAEAVPEDADAARETLIAYATGLLALLTSPMSIALNRAAMAEPSLAEALLASGRYRIGPLVADYLARLGTAGILRVHDPDTTFELLYGLVVRDTQIRVLLGERAPSRTWIRTRANQAVAEMWTLMRP